VGILARRRRPIVGTDLLADVTPIDMRADRFQVFHGQRPSRFDRQVRNAPVRIEDAGLDERARRAGLQAPGAASTLLQSLHVGLEAERADNLSEEEPRSDLRVDQARAEFEEMTALAEKSRAGFQAQIAEVDAELQGATALTPEASRVRDQIEEENTARNILARVKRAGNNPSAMLMLEQQFGSVAPSPARGAE